MILIKELLKSKNLTAKELAAKLGISEGALSKSLSGNPTLERLTEIATALDVPVSELFEAPKEGVITCPHCGKPITIEAKP
ncbi:MAG: helix-turn-helix transcriptional regulator [Bacteroides sp.]|nr:helix-turn-helix transcriptional regulator [Bacteroides sp.]MBD5375459.1 helix-turn-helix transcriptional regulator [Bacteroides sp.]